MDLLKMAAEMLRQVDEAVANGDAVVVVVTGDAKGIDPPDPVIEAILAEHGHTLYEE